MKETISAEWEFDGIVAGSLHRCAWVDPKPKPPVSLPPGPHRELTPSGRSTRRTCHAEPPNHRYERTYRRSAPDLAIARTGLQASGPEKKRDGDRFMAR